MEDSADGEQQQRDTRSGENCFLEQQFQRHEILGEGTYGVVYRATRRVDKCEVALKLMRRHPPLGSAKNRGLPAAAIREAALLRSLPPHPNVVELIDVIQSNGQLWLAFELCDSDLRMALRWQSRFKANISSRSSGSTAYHTSDYSSMVVSLAKQLLRGLAHCHARRIIHRDIKPQNLLLKNGVLKLADFGLARALGTPCQKNTLQVVTLWYRAPELLLGDLQYSTALDIWAAGCVIAEMFSGRPLFSGTSEIDVLLKIFRLLGTPAEPGSVRASMLSIGKARTTCWPGVSGLPFWSDQFPYWTRDPVESLSKVLGVSVPAPAVDLLVRMLSLDPALRPSAVTALSHPWLVSR